MKFSARNQLAATVKSVTQGTVMAEVSVELDGGGQEVVAAITATSAKRLGLTPGKKVIVMVKATEVIIASED